MNIITKAVALLAKLARRYWPGYVLSKPQPSADNDEFVQKKIKDNANIKLIQKL